MNPAKSFSLIRFAEKSLLIAILASSQAVIFGQGDAIKPTDGSRTPDATSAQQAEAMVGAKAKLRANDLAGAESVLAASSRQEPNSTGWHLDTAHKLVRLADELSRENDHSRNATIVGRALLQVDQAGNAARIKNDLRGQVQAKTAAAVIHERYLGDMPAAIAAYQAALQIDPSDKPAAEALERLQRTETTLRARLQSGNR